MTDIVERLDGTQPMTGSLEDMLHEAKAEIERLLENQDAMQIEIEERLRPEIARLRAVAHEFAACVATGQRTEAMICRAEAFLNEARRALEPKP